MTLYCDRCETITFLPSTDVGGIRDWLCDDCRDLTRLDDDGCPGASQYAERLTFEQCLRRDRPRMVSI